MTSLREIVINRSYIALLITIISSSTFNAHCTHSADLTLPHVSQVSQNSQQQLIQDILLSFDHKQMMSPTNTLSPVDTVVREMYRIHLENLR